MLKLNLTRAGADPSEYLHPNSATRLSKTEKHSTVQRLFQTDCGGAGYTRPLQRMSSTHHEKSRNLR